MSRWSQIQQASHDEDEARADLQVLLALLRKKQFVVSPGNPSTYMWNVIEIGHAVSVARLRSWEQREWVTVETLPGRPKRRRYTVVDGWDAQ